MKRPIYTEKSITDTEKSRICAEKSPIYTEKSPTTSHTQNDIHSRSYGVASISRFLEIIFLSCKRALLKRRYSAEETYNFSQTMMTYTEILWGGYD